MQKIRSSMSEEEGEEKEGRERVGKEVGESNGGMLSGLQ